MKRPADNEYASFFRGYVDLVPEEDLLGVLESQGGLLRRFAAGVPRDRETFAYAPGKWTIRQVMGHLGDGERVFGFRAFCFGRGDQTPLPGFDENEYVERSRYNEAPLLELAEDFVQSRESNLRTFRGFGEEEWSRSGVANGNAVTVRALAFVMAGHVRHHLKVLHERYGAAVDS